MLKNGSDYFNSSISIKKSIQLYNLIIYKILVYFITLWDLIKTFLSVPLRPMPDQIHGFWVVFSVSQIWFKCRI